MTRRTTTGGRRLVACAHSITRSSWLGRLAQVGLDHDPGRRAVAQLGLVEQLEDELGGGLQRVERLHVDVQVCPQLLRAPQKRAHPPRGVVAADLRRLGPQQRAERRYLDRQVRARKGTVRVPL